MKKTAIILILITTLTKFLGFIREIVLSYFWGASHITDAYLISLTIPATIFTFIGTGIVTGFIPVYSKVLSEEGNDSAISFTNTIINFILLFSLSVVIVVQFLTPQIVRLFASGFEDEILELAVNFTRISIISILFYGATFILNGYMEVNGKFSIPALSSIPLNLISIFAFALSTISSVYFLSYGSLLAAFSQMIFMIYFAKKNKFKYWLNINLKNKDVKLMLSLATPVIIGTSVNQLNVLVDRTIASRIAVGGISALNYANRLNLFIQSVLVLSLVTIMYPKISQYATEKNFVKFKEALSETIRSINLLILPVFVGFLIFSRQIVILLYGRGAFNVEAIILTSSSLFFYSVGIVAFGLREVLSRAFYAIKDTKTPMINAALGMILNIILNIILAKYLGVGGLALATSIAATFTTILLTISLRKKIGPFGMKQISISFLKILFASLVMGLISKISFNYLITSLSQNLSLLIALGVGAVSYLVIIYFMKIEDVDVIVGSIKKKFGRGVA